MTRLGALASQTSYKAMKKKHTHTKMSKVS